MGGAGEAAAVALDARCPCFYGWVIVVVGWVALLSAGPGHSYYFVVFLEPILNELQIERTVMSATWTGCLFAAAAAQPIAGRVLDGVGPKRMLLHLPRRG